MKSDLLIGDCREVMRSLASCSVDAIVTDPPYELGFMGKSWDSSGIAYDAEVWNECLRVLKPGGHLTAFSGSRTYHRLACAIEDAGFEMRDQIMWLYGSGFPKSHNPDDFSLAQTRQTFNGWGTALKPAHEPIVLARKPLEGKIIDNMLEYGTGAINVQGCRIVGEQKMTDDELIDAIWGDDGRWPANVAHDGSEEVMDEFAKYGERKAGGKVSGNEASLPTNGIYEVFNRRMESTAYQDSGSAGRFFYCAKATKEDRDEGLDGLARRRQDTSRKEGRPGGDNPRNRGLALRGNHHPTVKPTALMRWLVRLVTPPAGLILDPFMGSGSTGKAAVLEAFDFIGIEREREYVDIAARRIEFVNPQKFELAYA